TSIISTPHTCSGFGDSLYLDVFFIYCYRDHRFLTSFPTRRSSDLNSIKSYFVPYLSDVDVRYIKQISPLKSHNLTSFEVAITTRSEEHTSELQSRFDLVCRLHLEKKNTNAYRTGDGG